MTLRLANAESRRGPGSARARCASAGLGCPEPRAARESKICPSPAGWRDRRWRESRSGTRLSRPRTSGHPHPAAWSAGRSSGLVRVGLEHRCAARSERAISHDLDGPHGEVMIPVVRDRTSIERRAAMSTEARAASHRVASSAGRSRSTACRPRPFDRPSPHRGPSSDRVVSSRDRREGSAPRAAPW